MLSFEQTQIQDTEDYFRISKIQKGTCVRTTKLIDLWERPVEVSKRLDLIPSVLHDRTAQKTPPSLSPSPDVDDAPAGTPNSGTACHPSRRRCRMVAAPQASCG